MKNILYRASLRKRLVLAFIITSIIPIILLNLFSYYNTSGIVKDNVNEQTHANLLQLKSSLDVWVDSYEDILFQIYMNDDIVHMVEQINEGTEDLTMVRGQLRRILRGMFYTKEHIKSITVITESGEVVFYDLLTGSITKNTWLDELSTSKEELYGKLSEDNNTHMISTQEAGVFNAKTYYLFHLGHRIIDYKDVNKQLGVVIVSIDEEMLKEICNNEEGGNTLNFIVDKNGYLVSYPKDSMLGKKIITWSEDKKIREEEYLSFIREENYFSGEYVTVESSYDEAFGCDIVNVSNQNTVIDRLMTQQKIMLIVMSLSLITLVFLIIILIRSLTDSLQNLAGIMKRAGKGEMSARVTITDRMPQEVETIAIQFNKMLGRVEDSMEKEKEAGIRQKNAEIAALEAQINPHFLYNTLDTINWMAIDRDEYEISNSITALASILRYGIDKSNEIVTIRQECDWLKQYLFLQQTRLKNTFECEIHVAPEVLEWHIHKLLLQPFVENAILHGFEGKEGTHRLEITIFPDHDILDITIWDNGKGIPKEMLDHMNQGIFVQNKEKRHIGMENAINRIHIYYASVASVVIDSEESKFTKISIRIPRKASEL
ncbi:MAG: histidine kinase [Lachnospiraceae bacterium]|nr:histidine kinase [Lachnospiraceae bacterium]